MSGRKRKIYVSDLAAYSLTYHSIIRGRDEHGYFTGYYLDNEPSNAVREKLRAFEHIRIYRYRKREAPAIRGYIIRLYDKCIKDLEE